MSDWGGGDVGGDFGDFDWSSIFGGDPSQWGMGDRGLGTTDPGSPGGTLTPEQIAALGPGFDWSKLISGLGKSIGLTNNDGSANGMGWLSLLAPLLGAGLNYSSTGKATDQTLQGIKDAGTAATGLNAQNQALYKPYTDTVPGTLAQMQAAGNSNLASQYKPLGSGRGLTLGAMAKGR